MSVPTRPNLLVISDLHLGEDLKDRATPMSYLRRLALLEKELEAFLAHYSATRLEGRPWRLVVNGDMVDFMSVMILPGQGPGAEQHTADERRFGLAFGERQTVAKLDRVVERHPGVFQKLADFVAAGNELIVIVGNHDVEFHFPGVQRRFCDALAARMPTAEAGEATARIRFCNWFYFEEERVYVEHGHQYDEFCSFDYQLHPVDNTGGVALSIAHAGIRYFTNLVPSIDPAVAEHWGFVDFVRWAAGHTASALTRMFYLYGVFAWKAIALWSWLTHAESDAERRAGHNRQLDVLADELRIAVEKVRALDGLRRPPVIKRLGRTLQTLFLDRLALLVGSLALAALAIVIAPAGMQVGLLLGVGGVFVAGNYLLGRDRMPAPHLRLRHAPQRIRDIMLAPFVVFGHSHIAETRPLEGGGTYLNTGSWANEDPLAAFTHVLITGDDQPRAELRQWRGGQSAPYAPSSQGPVPRLG